jgi:hypothetical protein
LSSRDVKEQALSNKLKLFFFNGEEQMKQLDLDLKENDTTQYKFSYEKSKNEEKKSRLRRSQLKRTTSFLMKMKKK